MRFARLTAATRIGVVGIGNIGAALSSNLLKAKLNLHAVYDVQPKAMEPLPSKVIRAGSAKEVAQLCNIVATALPAPRHVKAAMEGEEGVLAGIREGSIWIDHSTTDYQQMLDLAAKCNSLGGHCLEAPLTGGMALLKQGLMTVFVGGNRKVYEECLPMLKASGKTVLYLGELGSATVTKVISNMLAATHNVATGEALMMAKRSNIDLRAFFQAIRYSSGNSFVFETEAPLVLNGTYDPDFTLELHCKDLSLGKKIADESGVPIRLHSLVTDIYNEARSKYGDEKGSSHPPKLLEDDLQESLQISGFDDWTYSVILKDDTIAIQHLKKKDVK